MILESKVVKIRINYGADKLLIINVNQIGETKIIPHFLHALSNLLNHNICIHTHLVESRNQDQDGASTRFSKKVSILYRAGGACR